MIRNKAHLISHFFYRYIYIFSQDRLYRVNETFMCHRAHFVYKSEPAQSASNTLCTSSLVHVTESSDLMWSPSARKIMHVHWPKAIKSTVCFPAVHLSPAQLQKKDINCHCKGNMNKIACIRSQNNLLSLQRWHLSNFNPSYCIIHPASCWH